MATYTTTVDGKTYSMRAYIYLLIDKGLSNKEIWATIQPMFNMPDTHSHYPAWYRRDRVRAQEKKQAKGQMKELEAQKVLEARAQLEREIAEDERMMNAPETGEAIVWHEAEQQKQGKRHNK